MKYSIGQLDRRITFIDPKADIENKWGELVPGRKEIATVWAKVEELRGKEKLKAGKDYATTDIQVICRYRDDIKTDMVIEYEDRELEVKSIIELGRRRYLEIMCEEIATKRGNKNGLYRDKRIR